MFVPSPLSGRASGGKRAQAGSESAGSEMTSPVASRDDVPARRQQRQLRDRTEAAVDDPRDWAEQFDSTRSSNQAYDSITSRESGSVAQPPSQQRHKPPAESSASYSVLFAPPSPVIVSTPADGLYKHSDPRKRPGSSSRAAAPQPAARRATEVSGPARAAPHGAVSSPSKLQRTGTVMISVQPRIQDGYPSGFGRKRTRYDSTCVF